MGLEPHPTTHARNVKRFRGGLVFKAHRWLYHSTLGSRVRKKKKNPCGRGLPYHDQGRAVVPSQVRPCGSVSPQSEQEPAFEVWVWVSGFGFRVSGFGNPPVRQRKDWEVRCHIYGEAKIACSNLTYMKLNVFSVRLPMT